MPVFFINVASSNSLQESWILLFLHGIAFVLGIIIFLCIN